MLLGIHKTIHIRPLQDIRLFLVHRPHAFGNFQVLNSLYTACTKWTCKTFKDKS